MTNERKAGISWRHRLATLVAVATFIQIALGELVSASTVSLVSSRTPGSAPDPASFANSPLKYEFAFRLTSTGVILLTLVLFTCLMTSRAERYLKILVTAMMGTLVAEVLLGFIPVFGGLPLTHSLARACGNQVLFSLAVCLALFTRGDWRWNCAKTTDVASPSLRQILVFTTGAIFLQTVLGESVLWNRLRLVPHLVLGIVVTLCAFWVLEMALSKFAHLAEFKFSAVLLAEIVGVELFLGIISYSMRLNAQAHSRPHPGLVVMQVTHAAVGTLALAASLFATFQGFKYLAPAEARVAAVQFQESREADSPD
jgi:heme A synthase